MGHGHSALRLAAHFAHQGLHLARRHGRNCLLPESAVGEAAGHGGNHAVPVIHCWLRLRQETALPARCMIIIILSCFNRAGGGTLGDGRS